ncbi:ParB/RepB/Spo0J family partition protein [Micromonospora sp. NPDC005203]|uniref:ParB/RepB/Spo0J family partition protein n=1 Tax=Micromonospora sp. NPDC005203 TaxID=3364226 RepID=UPI0036C222D8
MSGRYSVGGAALLERNVTDVHGHDRSDAAIAELPIADLHGVEALRFGGVNLAYARVLAESGAELPPILVQRSTMRVIDGAHRVRAALLCGQRTITAVLFDGCDREAFVLAVRLNVTHGLPLSLAERKAAATRILHDYPEWSDRSIASVTGVSDKTVGAIRRRSPAEIPQPTDRVARDGTISRRPLVEGRLRAAELIRSRPHAPLRQIADEAGISLTTAKDVRNRVRCGKDPLPARQRATVSGAVVAEPEFDEADAMAAELMMQRLRSDPAVRRTAGGRWVLRWLATMTFDEQGCERAVACLPPYHLETVARLARQRGAVWLRLAGRIEERTRSN